MAPLRTYEQVGDGLRKLDHFRVSATVHFAAEENDGVGGHHGLALCLRESNAENINGDKGPDGIFHARGAFQINDRWHAEFLKAQPGCPIVWVGGRQVGSWRPDYDHTALDPMYAPRFTPAMVYAIDTLASHRRQAIRAGIPKGSALRVAFNGYNQGIDGAIKAFKSDPGNPDRQTTGGDYGAWCLAVAKLVDRWLDEHPKWRVPS